MLNINKQVLFVAGSFVLGLVIGGLSGYFASRERFRRDNQEEVAALSAHYEKSLAELKNAYGVVEVDTEKEEKSVDYSSDLKPADIDTHAVNYGKYYNQEAKTVVDVKDILSRVSPEEDDDDDEEVDEDVIEISEEEYNRGDRPYREVVYAMADSSMTIVDWGDNEPLIEDEREDLLQMEEDTIITRITPLLKQAEFAKEPYDVMYIKDLGRNEQYKVMKRYGENLLNI